MQSVAEGGYLGIGQAFREIWATEGRQGFTRGTLARVLWIGPATTVAMVLCKSSLRYTLLRIRKLTILLDEQFKQMFTRMHEKNKTET